MLKRDTPGGEPDGVDEGEAAVTPGASTDRIVTAKYPNHVWHVDLTVMPTNHGFWTPWMPFARIQAWPFCWWLVVVVDHFSRRILQIGVFHSQPTSEDVCDVLDEAARIAGRRPKHIISDKGTQFWKEKAPVFYTFWCNWHQVNPRFGAVGQHGSIAIVERSIRTLKELLRRIVIPYRMNAMAREVALIVQWYNCYRPHAALGGATPEEIYEGRTPANEKPRIEPRAAYPPDARCAAPQSPIRGSPGDRVGIAISFLGGRRHLPVVQLREAA